MLVGTVFGTYSSVYAPAGLALVLVVLAAASCAKRITQVDPSYVTPEGRPSPSADLLVWQDAPNLEYVFNDVTLADPGPEDVPIDDPIPYRFSTEGAVD